MNKEYKNIHSIIQQESIYYQKTLTSGTSKGIHFRNMEE